MKKRLIEDLSKVSNVNVNLWAKIFDTIAALIEEYVYEAELALESQVDIDLEFATLSIVNHDGKLKIVFTPKESMVNNFKNTQKEKKTRLKKKLEKVVLSSLLETYKEI